MDSGRTLLDELASGEDEFDVDLMACGCRLVASPLGKKEQVTISEYLAEVPGMDAEQLRLLVELLIQEHHVSDKSLIEAIDRISQATRT